jgi:site-specific DNA-methyltransferase (adenine-specific)
MKLSELQQDSRNANKGTKRGNAAVEHSLKEFGAGRSILIDKHGVIIAGNKTASNAAAAGFEDVIVVPTDGTQLIAVQRIDLDLSADDKAKQLAIADNRSSELGLEWNPDVLGELAEEMDLEPYFTDAELNSILPRSIGLEDEDDVSEPPADPVTKLGDLILLGNHRLLCGDATVESDVARLMDGEKADMVWTDPPYNVAYEGKTKDALSIQNDSMDDDRFRQFLHDAFAAALAVTKPGGAIYVAHADLQGHHFRTSFMEAGWSLRSCLVWAKNSLVLGRGDYQWKHEPILYGWAPGAAHTWHGDRKQTTLLEFDRPSRSTEHPTMKPVALIEYCLANSSLKGQWVLDLFGGSGSTLMACEQTGRTANLMELDPRYCDVIVARWETLTGKKAERL